MLLAKLPAEPDEDQIQKAGELESKVKDLSIMSDKVAVQLKSMPLIELDARNVNWFWGVWFRAKCTPPSREMLKGRGVDEDRTVDEVGELSDAPEVGPNETPERDPESGSEYPDGTSSCSDSSETSSDETEDDTRNKPRVRKKLPKKVQRKADTRKQKGIRETFATMVTKDAATDGPSTLWAEAMPERAIGRIVSLMDSAPFLDCSDNGSSSLIVPSKTNTSKLNVLQYCQLLRRGVDMTQNCDRLGDILLEHATDCIAVGDRRQLYTVPENYASLSEDMKLGLQSVVAHAGDMARGGPVPEKQVHTTIVMDKGNSFIEEPSIPAGSKLAIRLVKVSPQCLNIFVALWTNTCLVF
jgi:hypothetical protein